MTDADVDKILESTKEFDYLDEEDLILTEDDLKSIDEAEEDLRNGKTVKLNA